MQVLVHVRPADQGGKPHFELLNVETHTSIQHFKQQVAEMCWLATEGSFASNALSLESVALQVERVGKQSGAYDLPAASQELVFMGERCQDDCTLADYAICEPWIAQVHTPVPLWIIVPCWLMHDGLRQLMTLALQLCVYAAADHRQPAHAGDWFCNQS